MVNATPDYVMQRGGVCHVDNLHLGLAFSLGKKEEREIPATLGVGRE